MSREGKLVKNIIVLSIGTLLPRLVSFIILPILTGCLTQEEYGTYDLVLVMGSLILPVGTMQIQTAAFRLLLDVQEDENGKRRIITNLYLFIIPISCVALVVVFLLLYSFPLDIRILMCVYFLLDILSIAARQIIRGFSRNFIYSVSATVSAVGKFIFVLISVWWMDKGLWGCIVSLCVADSLSLLYLLFIGKIYRYIDLSKRDFGVMKEMLYYSWPMVPNEMSSWIMSMSDRLVITFFKGVAATGVYAVANKIPSILALAQSTFTMAWAENASVAVNDEDAEQYYTNVFRHMFNFVVGFMTLLIAGTPILFRILVRGEYDEAYNQIPILVISMMFHCLSSYLGGIYLAMKKTKSIGITTTIAAISNLVVNIGLINWLGLYAASLSTLISYLFLFIYRMVNMKRFIKMQFEYRKMFIIFILLFVESFLCFRRSIICDIANIILAIPVAIVLNRQLIVSVFEKGKYILKQKIRDTK